MRSGRFREWEVPCRSDFSPTHKKEGQPIGLAVSQQEKNTLSAVGKVRYSECL